jgi:hypothetical protein
MPTLGSLLVLFSGAILVYLPLGFAERLVVACLTVFLVDAVGGRWFGYTALSVFLVGLLQDPDGSWGRMLPLLLGSGLTALVLRHVEPGWLGVPLAVLGFALPLVALIFVRDRLDPQLTLPLGDRYPLLHVLSVAFASMLSTLVAAPGARLARTLAGGWAGRARRGP